MAVLQVLPEVVYPVEFLCKVAFSELVNILDVTNALFPVLSRCVSGRNASHELPTGASKSGSAEVVATVAAHVGFPGAFYRILKRAVIH